ncbi:MAG TPA: carboxypeptidase-like regulatory domain-containing protein, partial [Planctomycetota bacterium]|nr:carboxypeptidase-like regulatory domain-containing protein [Planctomycetota bacterium]
MQRIRPKSVLVGLLLAIGAAGLAQCGSTAERPAARAPTGDAAPLPAAPSPPAGDGVLRAHLVRSRTGRPIPGTLRVTGPGGFVRWAAAGADGVACVDGLPRGVPLDAIASAPGLLSHPARGVWIDVDSDTDLGRRPLGEGMPIEVQIVGEWSPHEESPPVAGAVVEVRGFGGWGADPGEVPPVARATTGEDGRAVLRGVPPGQCRLVVRARGHGRESIDLDPVEGALRTPKRIHLGLANSLGGRLLDANGAALAGVNAFLVLGAHEVADAATTDSDGRFRFEDLP